MEINPQLLSAIIEVKKYWESQNIYSQPLRIDTSVSEKKFNIHDFNCLYNILNGMENIYPNYTDENGFLFYPFEALATVQNHIKGASNLLNDIVIFGDYFQKSWWYGVRKYAYNDYEIVILSDGNNIKKITNSLAEFLQLYLNDSELIYL